MEIKKLNEKMENILNEGNFKSLLGDYAKYYDSNSGNAYIDPKELKNKKFLSVMKDALSKDADGAFGFNIDDDLMVAIGVDNKKFFVQFEDANGEHKLDGYSKEFNTIEDAIKAAEGLIKKA